MVKYLDAKSSGLSRYDGLPCKRHGPVQRHISSRGCVLCNAESRAAYQSTAAGRAKRQETDRARYQKNKRNYRVSKDITEWIKMPLQYAKRRAKAYGLPFDLDEKYIQNIWTGVCPVFGWRLTFANDKRNLDNQATLDRIVPELGYVKGNVVFISNMANRIKNNANSDEIRRVADWLSSVELKKTIGR